MNKRKFTQLVKAQEQAIENLANYIREEIGKEAEKHGLTTITFAMFTTCYINNKETDTPQSIIDLEILYEEHIHKSGVYGCWNILRGWI